jgi:hypothetical protein
MPIRRTYLTQIRSIPGLTLPAILQVYDTRGAFVDHVILWLDGQLDTSSGLYPHPSAFRATFDPNGPTYSRFFFNGRSLRDWGVVG